MEQLLALWAELPNQTKTLIGDAGIIVIILLLAAKIKQGTQRKLVVCSIDCLEELRY